MKHSLLLVSFLVILFSACNEDTFSSENFLLEKDQTTKQIFNLGLTEDTLITGAEGTKIYFNRNLFEVSKMDSLRLVLKEYYNFKSLAYRGVSTITDKNELLETSGVIYIDVLKNGKSLELKEGQVMRVQFPKGKLSDNEIFYAQIDSLEQFRWKHQKTQVEIAYPDIKKNKTFGLVPETGGYYTVEEVELPLKDSIANRGDIIIGEDDMIGNFEFENTVLLTSLQWINIDRIIDADGYITFVIDIGKKPHFEQFQCYVLYTNLNSFMYPYLSQDLQLDSIPLKGKTSLLLLAHDQEEYFYDVFNLQKSKTTYHFTPHRTTLEDVMKLMDRISD